MFEFHDGEVRSAASYRALHKSIALSLGCLWHATEDSAGQISAGGRRLQLHTLHVLRLEEGRVRGSRAKVQW